MREGGHDWVNSPMKIVGRVRHLDASAALVWNASLCKLLPSWAKRRPQGVFRFKTWKAANQWDTEDQANGETR